MIDIEKFIADLHLLSQEQLVRLEEELILMKAGIDTSELQSSQDITTIDFPIDSLKDEETGVLYIRYPFTKGMRNTPCWQEMKVTPIAQAVLVQIFSASLADDAKAGRNQPPKLLTL